MMLVFALLRGVQRFLFVEPRSHISFGENLLSFAFQKVFEIVVVFNHYILFTLLAFIKCINSKPFSFRDFDYTVIQVFVLEIVILFEFRFCLIGAIQYEVFLLGLKQFALFRSFNRLQNHTLLSFLLTNLIGLRKHFFLNQINIYFSILINIPFYGRIQLYIKHLLINY